MWNIQESNKQIGFFMKRESFRRHLVKVNSIKSQLNMSKCRPWRPTFSISKKQNRFSKNQQYTVDYNNDHLIRNLANIDLHPKIKTVLEIPFYIPSHKQNYSKFKQRERVKKMKEVSKQNLKVFAKIFTAQTSYNRNRLQKCWMENQEHKKIMSKKQKCMDYRQQVVKSLTSSRINLPINLSQKNKISSTSSQRPSINNKKCLSMRESVKSKFKHIL